MPPNLSVLWRNAQVMATFFFNNDISFRIAHALSALVHEHKVIALRDQFPVGTPDIVWIPEIGKNGWILISRDQNQGRRDISPLGPEGLFDSEAVDAIIDFLAQV